LSGKIEEAQSAEVQEKLKEQQDMARDTSRSPHEKSTLEKVLTSSTTRSIGTAVAKEVTRGLLGILGIKTTTRRAAPRKRNFPWF
jgi:hypothetical protein